MPIILPPLIEHVDVKESEIVFIPVKCHTALIQSTLFQPYGTGGVVGLPHFLRHIT